MSILVTVGFAIWSFLLIARVPLLSHLHKISGDSLDGMLALGIEMHWPHVFNGTAIGWRTTNYFFPVRDTLGYNDAFFLHGVLATLFRLFGIDPFLGMQLSDWCFRSVGFISMFALTRRWFGWPTSLSALAAALFVTANSYYQHDAIHAQFLACYCVPLLMLLQIESIVAARAGLIRKFLLLAIGFAMLFGALLITGFYVAFFFVLSDVLALLLLAAFGLWGAPASAVRPLLRRNVGFVAAQVFAVILFAVPFFMIYLPKAAETGMHRFSDIAPYALRPWDIVNVGPYNLLWGHFFARVLGHVVGDWKGSFENQTGVTPIEFALFLIGGFSLRAAWRSSWRHASLFALWCTTLLLLVITIRWPHWGWPWEAVYRLIPGAAAVRVVSRIQLVLLIPILLVACDLIAQCAQMAKVRPLLVLVSALLLLEQINDRPVFLIDRPAQLAFFSSVDHAPAACGVFFAENSRAGPDVQTRYRHNVDSMILAELSGTPTFNGYATFLPPHWHLVHPGQPDYLASLREWLALHPTRRRICGVNFQTRTWTVEPR